MSQKREATQLATELLKKLLDSKQCEVLDDAKDEIYETCLDFDLKPEELEEVQTATFKKLRQDETTKTLLDDLFIFDLKKQFQLKKETTNEN